MHVFYSYAASAEVYAEPVHASGETVVVPLSIRGNPGLMGFKLMITYDASVLEPRAVTRGAATQSGIMNDSIGAGQSGTLLIVWNDSDETKAEGTLAVLTFTARQQKDTTLTVACSQPDTFDGSYNDVELDCKPVTIVFDGQEQSTPQTAKTPDSHDIAAAMDSVEDKTDVAAVNEVIRQLTRTENYFETPEEAQSAYHTAVAADFVETALLAANSKTIDAAIQAALEEAGAQTVDAVPAEKQAAFVRTVENALLASAPDVPKISGTLPPQEAAAAIRTLQEQNQKNAANGIPVPEPKAEQPRTYTVLVCCIGATVVLAASVAALGIYKRNKHKEELSE